MLKINLIERRFTHIKHGLTQIKRKTKTHNLRPSAFDPRKSAFTNIFNLQNGQALAEYVILVSIVAAVFVAMSAPVKRGIQSVIKYTADQLAPQNEAEQNINSQSGYVTDAFTATRTTVDKQTQETPGGITNYIYNDTTHEASNTQTNLGFSGGN